MVKVSVVIPVYNVENYLSECLDSIVDQTLTDIEIICINDGSTDNSLKILKEYANKDTRITIIDQENKGHAAATNRGIKLAKGKYIYLMDSDDILDTTALKETVKIAEEKNVDFVIFQAINYYMDSDGYAKKEKYSMDELADYVKDKVFNWKDIKEYIFSIAVTPWSKLYKTEFIKNNNIEFPEGLVFDDNVFFWDSLFTAQRITFYKKYLFTRRWHTASSTMSGNRNFFDSIQIFDLIFDTFKKHNTFEEFKEKLYNRRVSIGYLRLSLIKPEYKEEFFNKLKNSLIQLKTEEDYYPYLTKRRKIIYDAIMNHETYKEAVLTVKNYDLEREIFKLNKKNNKLEHSINKYEKANKKILNSRSWKITKPLRNIKNIFK